MVNNLDEHEFAFNVQFNAHHRNSSSHVLQQPSPRCVCPLCFFCNPWQLFFGAPFWYFTCNYGVLIHASSDYTIPAFFFLSSLLYTSCLGLARTVYIHRIWPYIWSFSCQKYRIYTVYVWLWPTLLMSWSWTYQYQSVLQPWFSFLLPCLHRHKNTQTLIHQLLYDVLITKKPHLK